MDSRPQQDQGKRDGRPSCKEGDHRPEPRGCATFLPYTPHRPPNASPMEERTPRRPHKTLSPAPSQAIRRLHAGLRKTESAILTQLRTGKIDFNKFLFDPGVPTVLKPQCACEQSTMTVFHVLLSCTLWTEKRQQELRPLQTTALRRILRTPAGRRPAVRFILQTGLLAQFGLFAREEQARREGEGEL